ncbi:hypothetical protein BASA50_000627 [Batrachochytrium salamandrivorans]|uniref:Oxidation resistance protein 1 n=1 Tax=Batrachochytrium salamandrivorans TaxID=1357716 RepID=A0ABQ8ET48_9FUNG|nr:hypothetical protein BASA50_000627 [Batrachochytrium salamandrivorans]
MGQQCCIRAREEPLNAAAWLDPKVDKMCASLPLDKTKLKSMVVAGIPPHLRHILYPKLLKIDQLDDFERDFKRAQTRTYGLVVPPDPIPPTFGGRSHQSTLALTPAGSIMVRHILCIISHDNPNLEYCPFLPPLVALLAHHIDSPDILLACVTSLLRLNTLIYPSQVSSLQLTKSFMPGESDPSHRWRYIPIHRREAKLFSRAFGNLLYQTDRKLHSHLTELHSSSPDPFWTAWIHNMFTHILPQPLLWRFLDSFIVEGYKAFLRFGMAILIQQRGAILKLQSIWELTQLITPSLFVDAAIVRSTKYATIADEMCATAAGVFINYANVKRVHMHHASLVAVSQESCEGLETGMNHLRFQRALPKFIGDGVAAIMDQQRGSDIEPMEDEDDTDAELSPPKPRRPVSCMASLEPGRICLDKSHALSVCGCNVVTSSKATPGDPALLQVEDANQQQQQQQLLQPQPQPRIQVDFFVADSDESDIYPASNRTPSVGGVPSSVRSLSPRKSFSSERSTSPQLGIELLPASTIADTDYWVALWSWIPPHKRMDSIELVFTTKVHGYHIKTMYEKLHHRQPIILAIETTRGETFGAYLSDGLPHLKEEPHLAGKWIGSGETFVFSLVPHAKMFPWVGRLNEDMSGDSYFVNASLTSLTIGGGGEHVAIHLDAELRYGSTGKCTTFMNDAFTMDKRTRFECLVVEAFAFSSA